eukprot:103367-Chlamydomonas_euryale.AAC.2
MHLRVVCTISRQCPVPHISCGALLAGWCYLRPACVSSRMVQAGGVLVPACKSQLHRPGFGVSPRT